MSWSAALAAERARLERGARALEAWLDTAEPVWSTRPAPEAWSVAEVLEHVTLTQHFLLLLIEKLARRGLARARRGDVAPAPGDHAALDALASRDFRWERPEHMAPSGGVARAELALRLADQTRRALAVLELVPDGQGALADARMATVDARLDAYGFLHLYVLHAERHVRQLERTARALTPAR